MRTRVAGRKKQFRIGGFESKLLQGTLQVGGIHWAHSNPNIQIVGLPLHCENADRTNQKEFNAVRAEQLQELSEVGR